MKEQLILYGLKRIGGLFIRKEKVKTFNKSGVVGLDKLPEVAGHLAGMNTSYEYNKADEGLIDLISKSRKYINLMLDEVMGTEDEA